jgi:hypothetical protein
MDDTLAVVVLDAIRLSRQLTLLTLVESLL